MKVSKTLQDFRTYIENNQGLIPKSEGAGVMGRENIATAFVVESTINHVVAKRFVKKQQMQ